MLYRAQVRSRSSRSLAPTDRLVEATRNDLAQFTALFYAIRILGLPEDTAVVVRPFAPSEADVECDVFQAFAHLAPLETVSRVRGIAAAQACLDRSSPAPIAGEIHAVLGNERLALPAKVPFLEACDVRYVDANGHVQSLGCIDHIDLDAPVSGVLSQARSARHAAHLLIA